MSCISESNRDSDCKTSLDMSVNPSKGMPIVLLMEGVHSSKQTKFVDHQDGTGVIPSND